MTDEVTIYTDGACSGNPGPGGFAAILVCRGKEKVITGGERETTNNRMELKAVISGLQALKRRCDVTVCSDSKYVVDSLTLGWAKSWRENGWRKSDRSHALNVDLWEELLALDEKYSPKYVWVHGHAGHEYNERCDALAVAETEKFR
ncbi:MAG: ribonuclease HI [Clostridia bacterium]|nr:ribonuclease HI [Clostridia bacterium]MBO4423829.1 ribonuclease HI [Clostridia bacterium]